MPVFSGEDPRQQKPPTITAPERNETPRTHPHPHPNHPPTRPGPAPTPPAAPTPHSTSQATRSRNGPSHPPLRPAPAPPGPAAPAFSHTAPPHRTTEQMRSCVSSGVQSSTEVPDGARETSGTKPRRPTPPATCPHGLQAHRPHSTRAPGEHHQGIRGNTEIRTAAADDGKDPCHVHRRNRSATAETHPISPTGPHTETQHRPHNERTRRSRARAAPRTASRAPPGTSTAPEPDPQSRPTPDTGSPTRPAVPH